MRKTYVGIVAVLAMLATACGGEGLFGAGGGTDDTTAAFCQGLVDGEAAFMGEPDPAEMGALLDTTEANAPEPIEGDVTVLVAGVRSVLETGDFSAMDSPEWNAAEGSIDSFMVENCGWDELDVTAVDYSFSGMPSEIAAGTYAIGFSNEGAEVHEMAVVRINDGVTETIHQLLELPEEEAMSKVGNVGGAFAFPGESDTTFVELAPGRYAVICFVPTGATPDMVEALESGEFQGGPPHFMEGMISEFTVTG